jgi:spermidine synthase
MIPWFLVGAASIPGGGTLRLMRRGAEFSLRLGDNELMNSRLGGSEEKLAAVACEKLRGRRSARLLIGGLGMGFTLRAALDGLGPDARVDVVELVPDVVAWANGPLRDLFGSSMQDERAFVRIANVADVVRQSSRLYDAILLDVDNGPDGLTVANNDALYSPSGLRAAGAALRPGGVLVIWSAGPDAAFAKRLSRAGFKVDEVKARASGARGGSRHVIWIGEKPRGPAN